MANRGAQKRKTLARKAAQPAKKPERPVGHIGHYTKNSFGFAAIAAMLAYESRRK